MHVKTLQDIVVSSKNNFQNDIALQIRSDDGYRRISFFDAYKKIARLAAHLKLLGVHPGDKVGILSENRPEWGLSYLAITYFGAIAVPLDAMLSTEELEYIISDSETKTIFCSSALKLKHKLAASIILMEDFDELPEREIPLPEINEDDLAAIVYTSGTTGYPKGVMLTHKNLVSNVLAVSKLFKIRPGDNFLSVLPLHHTFEATCGFLCPFYLGAKITYAESLKSYNLLKNMQETKVTIMCGVPLLYNLFYDGIMRELNEKGSAAKMLFSLLLGISKIIKMQYVRRKLFLLIHKKLGGSINFWVSGGAAIDPEIIKNFDLFGITICQGYGLTESSPILTCNNLQNNRIGSVGLPLPGVVIKITEDGEIIARGPNIMKGYYKNPEQTSIVLRDGWLYTGDKGKIDSDGYVYITGRIKDIIVTGSGVNVAPEELEFHLNKIKGIKESCVLGAKVQSGAHRGMEEVFAVIIPDYDYLKKHAKHIKHEHVEMYIHGEIQKLNEKLAAYKRISKIKIRSIEFPKTSTKKIRRYQVKREMGI